MKAGGPTVGGHEISNEGEQVLGSGGIGGSYPLAGHHLSKQNVNLPSTNLYQGIDLSGDRKCKYKLLNPKLIVVT